MSRVAPATPATIAIAGSSGLIGTALVSALRAADRRVLRIVRRTPANSDELHWNPDAGPLDPGVLDGVDAVVNAVGPALREHGVIVLPEVLDDMFREYQSKSGGQMQECRVWMRYTFVGPDGSTLSCSAIGQSSDSSDKAASKAQSVAYRVALLQALCIPTDEPDPDATSHERATPPTPEPVIPTDDAERMKGLLNAASADDRKAFVTRFGCKPDLLPVSRLDEANDWLSDLEASEGE